MKAANSVVGVVVMQSLEPFFSVVLSSIFLGDRPTLLVLLTLFPIVGGVAAASMSEVSSIWRQAGPMSIQLQVCQGRVKGVHGCRYVWACI